MQVCKKGPVWYTSCVGWGTVNEVSKSTTWGGQSSVRFGIGRDKHKSAETRQRAEATTSVFFHHLAKWKYLIRALQCLVNLPLCTKFTLPWRLQYLPLKLQSATIQQASISCSKTSKTRTSGSSLQQALASRAKSTAIWTSRDWISQALAGLNWWICTYAACAFPIRLDLPCLQHTHLLSWPSTSKHQICQRCCITSHEKHWWNHWKKLKNIFSDSTYSVTSDRALFLIFPDYFLLVKYCPIAGVFLHHCHHRPESLHSRKRCSSGPMPSPTTGVFESYIIRIHTYIHIYPFRLGPRGWYRMVCPRCTSYKMNPTFTDVSLYFPLRYPIL